MAKKNCVCMCVCVYVRILNVWEYSSSIVPCLKCDLNTSHSITEEVHTTPTTHHTPNTPTKRDTLLQLNEVSPIDERVGMNELRGKKQ